MLKRFTHQTRINVHRQAVAAFHADTRALKRLTPPPVFVEIHSAEPLGEGSLSEFTMWMGPLPVRWVARHSHVDPISGFTDEQVRGPFTRWVHRHYFREVNSHMTVIEDEVLAIYGTGVFSGLISRLMWFGLPFMFVYREWVLKRALE